MYNFLLVLLIFISVQLNAQPSRDIVEKYRYYEIGNSKVNFKADKGQGFYSKELELLFVSPKNNTSYLINKYGEIEGVHIREEVCSKIDLERLPLIIENELKERKRPTQYANSVLLLVYLITLFSFFMVGSDKWRVFNIFSKAIPNAKESLLLIFLTSLMSSFILSDSFFGKLFVIILVFLLFKFVVGLFLDNYLQLNSNSFMQYNYLFKGINIVFVGYVAMKLAWFENVNILIFMDYYFYILLLFFLLFSVYHIVISTKKVRLHYLFYYLCALEILPVLFLKEYYI